mgnify:FL=1
MNETERIDLGSGQWWDIRTRLTRAMEKAVTKASLGAIPQMRLDGETDPEKIRSQILGQMAAVDIGAIEDVYLLKGTVTYSFGPTVDIATIDALDAGLVRQVLTRMYELYTPQRLSQEKRDGFFETQSKVS